MMSPFFISCIPGMAYRSRGGFAFCRAQGKREIVRKHGECGVVKALFGMENSKNRLLGYIFN